MNTVQTLLRIMETKGLVTHTAEGRSFIYRPLFSREETASRFLDRVFDGAASQLVLSLLRAEKIPPEELEHLRQMINAARKKDGCPLALTLSRVFRMFESLPSATNWALHAASAGVVLFALGWAAVRRVGDPARRQRLAGDVVRAA